tara:strand:- start:606 stop:830 length:225 start_codon:yes stop_codon:yes gene_type:complete
MYGPKETAVMIMQGKRPGGMAEEEEMEFGEEEMEEEVMEYSDEQHGMAEELMSAVNDGDTQGILEAIHGIYMSY